MPDGSTSNHGKALWIGVGKQILTFAAGVVAAAFILGTARQKVNDVIAWKAEVAPRIERMDRQGSLSFEQFHIQYEKEQALQYERLKELEKEGRQIDVMKQKIEALERAQLDRNPRYQPPEPRR
jgi:hypothetical protein